MCLLEERAHRSFHVFSMRNAIDKEVVLGVELQNVRSCLKLSNQDKYFNAVFLKLKSYANALNSNY